MESPAYSSINQHTVPGAPDGGKLAKDRVGGSWDQLYTPLHRPAAGISIGPRGFPLPSEAESPGIGRETTVANIRTQAAIRHISLFHHAERPARGANPSSAEFDIPSG